MTREEAIANLKDILEESTRHEDSVCYVTGEDAETLKIAISALQQVVKDTNVPCTDMISRKAAIELIENESRKWGDEYEISDVLCDLADMPSAQPDTKAAYEQGRIMGHVEMRTELLMQLKEIVGGEVWANI